MIVQYYVKIPNVHSASRFDGIWVVCFWYTLERVRACACACACAVRVRVCVVRVGAMYACVPPHSHTLCFSDGGRVVTHQQVSTMAARLFSGIRFLFVKYIRNKLNAFFLDPM